MADETRIIVVNQGTDEQWSGTDARTLEPGEFGYSTDSDEIKIGNGTDSFADRPALLTKENASKELSDLLNGKVDKVAGKQLSTEDYTSAEKDKLAGVANGAQVNAVTSVASKTGDVTLAKADVGLGDADNTSDANKPISTATQTALNGKVDKVSGKSLSSNDFTTAEKAKLAGLENSHFRGQFATLAALQAITGSIGDYAYVDSGVGQNVTTYSWDATDSKWVDQKGVTTAETPASIKSKYESNPDTNAYTDAEKSKIASIAAGAEVNQNAVQSLKVGSTVLTASTKTDTIAITAGPGVTVEANTSTKTVTVSRQSVRLSGGNPTMRIQDY